MAAFVRIGVFVSLLTGCAATPSKAPDAASAGGAHDYDPCASKRCGDPCTLCSPDDPDCVETAEVKTCDTTGTCGSAAPVCEDESFEPCTGRGCGDPETPSGRAPQAF